MNGIPVEHLSALRLSGRDAVRFLHAQLSADIEGLADGAATFACLCQPKGRVIALLLVWRRADHLLVLCARPLVERIVPHLQRFVFRDDVTIEHLSDHRIHGHQDELEDAAVPLAGLAYRTEEQAPGSQESPNPEAIERFRAHELALGVAWLDEDSSEAFLPQMMGAGAIGALNYRKGCYPGQEVVARTHYLGRLKQRPLLVRLEADSAPAVMESSLISDGGDRSAKAIVLDRARRAGNGWQLMLVVRSTETFEASRLTWEQQGADIVACWPEADVPRSAPADARAS